MRNTFINALLEEARRDSKIVLIVGDLGYGVVDEFAKELPKQFINFGINEQSMMSAAAGLASKGLKPYVYSIGNFPTFRCMEQIRNDVCYMNMNVTIVALGAGFSYGTAGYSHHLVEDIGIMHALPNMRVFSPADPLDTKKIVPILVTELGPKYVRLGKGGEKVHTNDLSEIYPGIYKNNVKSSQAVLVCGPILGEVRSALHTLEKNNIRLTLYSISDFNSIRLLGELESYSKIFTVEEHNISNGFGSIINNFTSFKGIEVCNLGVSDIDSSLAGSQDFLRKEYRIDANAIANAIKERIT